MIVLDQLPREHKLIALVSLILALVLSALLVYVSPESGLEAILSSLLGVLIMVAAVLVLIAGIEENRRRQEWENLRDVTFTQIADHMLALPGLLSGPLGGVFHDELLDTISASAQRPQLEGPGTLERFAHELRDLDPEKYAELDDDGGASVIEYVWDRFPLQEDINRLRDVLIPRVLSISENETLKGELVRLEDDIRMLRLRVHAHLHGDLESDLDELLDTVADYSETTSRVYDEMLEDGWE